ncbi:MAG: 50S ribosomal protein L25 [Candidatus Paceibacterota bacterium]
MLSLKIETRKIPQNLKSLKSKGQMPAVFYGKKEKSTPVSVSLAEFLKVWKKAGESSVVALKREDGEDLEALIHEVDLDPVTDTPRHADFYVFEKGHKIEVHIPLEFVGVAPGVKDLGGTLVKVLRELKIEAMPKDLPHEIKVDISTLTNFDSQILAKDIVLPSGVTLVEGADEVVALVAEAKEIVEEVSAPIDLSAIEVEKKGKKEEEGAEGSSAEATKSE